MIPGIVLGFGIGLAAYGCSKLLFGKTSAENISHLSESHESFNRYEVVATTVPVAPTEESLGHSEPTVEASRIEQEEEASLPAQEDTLVQRPDSASETTAGNHETEPQSWYVIATSKGLLRACKCSSRTPHTVAGPFATKKEAQQAKEQHK